MDFEVYYVNGTQTAAAIAKDKGYRPDVYVKYNGQYFHLVVYDSVRLIQDFEDEIRDSGFFAIDPNLVLVKNVTSEEIHRCVEGLIKQKYFDEIKPVEAGSIDAQKFTPVL
jgi:hypothetical protein